MGIHHTHTSKSNSKRILEMRITEKRFGKFIVEAETGINRLFLNLNTPQTEKKDGPTDRPTDRKADQDTITHVLASGRSGIIVFFSQFNAIPPSPTSL